MTAIATAKLAILPLIALAMVSEGDVLAFLDFNYLQPLSKVEWRLDVNILQQIAAHCW